MKLENLTYFGSRQFFKGLIETGSRLGDWSYCIRLVATRLNMELTIGGVEQHIADGRTLLDVVVNTAREGKFTQEEADVIADQLDRISFLYSSMRTPFYVNAYVGDAPVQEKIPAKVLTPLEEVAKIDVAEQSPVEDVVEKVPAKRGRKSGK